MEDTHQGKLLRGALSRIQIHNAMKFPHGKCVTSVLPPKLEDIIVFLSQIIKLLAYFKHWSEKAERWRTHPRLYF